MNLNPETDLTFTRTLSVPPALVWECWTSPEHIPHFFIPAPHKVTSCDIDLRVGGRFNTTFDVDGNVMENKGVWLELIPNKRFVFTDGYTEGWAPNPDPFMTAIVDLKEGPDGGTLYTATARHRSAEARQMHEDMGFFDGWGLVATQLEAYAKTL